MKIWKKNLIIIALVVFVGVAVYLNWQYNKADQGSEDYAQAEDSGVLLGDTKLVDGAADELAEQAEAANATDDESNEYESENDYFAATRLSRQKSRDAALALLEEAVSVQGITQDEVDETSEEIEAMAAMTMAESNIESLIIAKGFEDCVAFADDDSISIVVAEPTDGFTVSDIAKITDIVTTELNYTSDQIKIVGV